MFGPQGPRKTTKTTGNTTMTTSTTALCFSTPIAFSAFADGTVKATANAPNITPYIFPDAAAAWLWATKMPAPQPHTAAYQTRIHILRLADGLYRQRQLDADEMRILVFYGRRGSAPEAKRYREQRAAFLWQRALSTLTRALQQAGYIPNPLRWH